MTINTIKATAVFLASALLCFTTPAPVFAQDRPGAAASGADVSRLLKQADTQLTELEQAAESMESSGVVMAETAVTFGDVLTAYAETMHQATDAALQAAALAAQTKGRSGSVEPLANFEKLAKNHEGRTAALQRRLAAISEKMSGGSIKTVGFGPALREMFDRLNTPIVAPAQAALAIPALAPCIAQNWVQCAIKIATAIPAAVNAWSSYKSCMNNPPGVPAKPSPPSSKPWWSYPGRYAQYLVQLGIYNLAVFKRNNYQTGCVVTFVAKIA